MTIQHQPCPRCQMRRTVRLYGSSYCFNCRYPWTKVRREMSYPFAGRELERLMMYRNAVRAGIYSDWPVFA